MLHILIRQIYNFISRFLEQELFKSDVHMAVPLSQLQGKCYVMSVKEYFKNKPEGIIYISECEIKK